jgi:hypothetical protein
VWRGKKKSAVQSRGDQGTDRIANDSQGSNQHHAANHVRDAFHEHTSTDLCRLIRTKSGSKWIGTHGFGMFAN